jgi:steroid 5-alpha reductase family enzyme
VLDQGGQGLLLPLIAVAPVLAFLLGILLLWWGFFLIALANPGGWWTVISPVLMTTLLMKVSGVALLEKTLVKTRPEYQDYIRRTSAFFPLPPRR